MNRPFKFYADQTLGMMLIDLETQARRAWDNGNDRLCDEARALRVEVLNEVFVRDNASA